jgi:sec-independent protein translocase protein TatB
MFDMGFTELMLIGIVALVVIGPERLPAVARTAGKYLGRLKRFMTSVKADVEQELRADELRQILADQQSELNSIKDSMNEAGKAVEKEINAVSGIDAKPADNADSTPPPAAEIAGEQPESGVSDSTTRKPAGETRA